MRRLVVGGLLSWAVACGCHAVPGPTAACKQPPCDAAAGDCPSCDVGDCGPTPWCLHHTYLPWCDDIVTKKTARKCAKRTLAEMSVAAGAGQSPDFRRGFEQAYVDVALGSRPVVPAVPPPRYWQAYYRSPAGKPLVNEWFAGYEAGLESAAHSGVSQFNRVASTGRVAYVAPGTSAEQKLAPVGVLPPSAWGPVPGPTPAPIIGPLPATGEGTPYPAPSPVGPYPPPGGWTAPGPTPLPPVLPTPAPATPGFGHSPVSSEIDFPVPARREPVPITNPDAVTRRDAPYWNGPPSAGAARPVSYETFMDRLETRESGAR